MDKLEKYILDNRDNLDRYTPDNSVWENIERNTGKKKTSFRKIFYRAALLLVITSLSFMAYLYITTASQTRIAGPSDENLSSHLRETEIYYAIKVNGLLEKAKPLLTDKPDLEKELLNDISVLDSICLQIKNDLKDNISNQEVIEALILNYRIKVDILEEMLSVLEEKENQNTKKQPDHEL